MTRVKDLAHVRTWLASPLDRDVEASLVRLATAADVVQLAVMPDVHVASDVCVGVALATNSLIYPAAVGGDIGCGMLAVRFHASANCLRSEAAAARLLAGLYRGVPPLKHPTTSAIASMPSDLLDAPLSHLALEKLKPRDARLQLGTLGRGNHFVEFQRDESDDLWLLLHSGSRGMGQAITSHHTQLRTTDVPGSKFVTLESQSPEGRAYLNDQAWARRYAAANRLAMLEAIVELMRREFPLEPDRDSMIHSDHNHVQRELHGGMELWVHRKGAQSAACDEPGIIPGSMGTTSHHTIGRGAASALCSSSHGAGRIMSRTEASRRIAVVQIRREVKDIWIDAGRLNKLRDEAPSAYRDIRKVLAAQRDLCRVVRTLRPILNFKY